MKYYWAFFFLKKFYSTIYLFYIKNNNNFKKKNNKFTKKINKIKILIITICGFYNLFPANFSDLGLLKPIESEINVINYIDL